MIAAGSPTGRRVLLVTGKGGTGKTTVAASTALRLADRGARTLVLSTDAAHSLSDVLGRRVGCEPTPITSSLSAIEVDAQRLLNESWSTIRDYLQELLEWAGADSLRAEELAVVPGLEELLALRSIGDHLDEPWDAVVVDCAPTAETVRLLALPSTLRYYIDRALPTHRRLVRSVAPVLRRSASMPPAPVGVLDALLTLADELGGLHTTLTDPDVTSIRLVTTPESMVVAETRRVWSYLGLFDYPVDSVVVNRVVPSDPDTSTDPWLDRVRRAQEPNLVDIDRIFDNLGRARAPILPAEVVGVERLRAFGIELYGDRDPLAWPGRPVRVNGAPDHMVSPDEQTVTMTIPGALSDEVEVARAGSVLLVTIGPYRRSLVLPAHLQGRRATGARVSDGRLEVEFAGA